MLSDGFVLIYANCNEYFRSAAHTQQRLIFGRDLLGTLGTLGTGIVALARASKDATAVVALITSTGYAIMDDIAKDFLFSADNVEAVRDLTLRTMQKLIRRRCSPPTNFIATKPPFCIYKQIRIIAHCGKSLN